MLKFSVLLLFACCFFLKYTVATELQDQGLELLYSGKSSKYYVSQQPADVITAAETCAEMNKDLKLLSIENEDEFQDILSSLKDKGIDAIWTSGLQTVSNESTKYIWTGSSLPFSYSNFADILQLSRNSRLRRSVPGSRYSENNYGYHPSPPALPQPNCICDDHCPEPPTCEAPNCTITAPDCHIDQPYCSCDNIPECYILEPQPHCTVTCPPCTLTRGTCEVTRGKCTVTKPPVCTTKRGHCELQQPICSIEQGKCTLVHQPCVVQKPPPCEKPPTCVYSPTCNTSPDTDKPCKGSHCPLTTSCKGSHCSTPPLPCKGSHCPTTPRPCQGSECKCHRAFHCVADIVCEAPVLICPTPIYHCLPPELNCRPEVLVCSDPETVCEPPVVYCPPYEKKCTEDIIVCPAAKTTCTAAVSHCPKAETTCVKPSVSCPKPHVHCGKLPSCEVPPPCFVTSSYGKNNGNNGNCNDYCKNSHRRAKRSLIDAGSSNGHALALLEPEDILETKCVSLNKAFGFKWTLEACENKKHFICESGNK